MSQMFSRAGGASEAGEMEEVKREEERRMERIKKLNEMNFCSVMAGSCLFATVRK